MSRQARLDSPGTHSSFLANLSACNAQAGRAKNHAVPQCRKLLGLNPALPQVPNQSAHDLLLELTGIDLARCPAWKKGTMIIVAELPKLRPWDSSLKTALTLHYHRGPRTAIQSLLGLPGFVLRPDAWSMPHRVDFIPGLSVRARRLRLQLGVRLSRPLPTQELKNFFSSKASPLLSM